MSILDPITHALAAVLSAAHTSLATMGADPASGAIWLLSVAALVATVRLVLVPLALHGVRVAHAAARARPDLQRLTKQYRGTTDPDALRHLVAERRRISAEHGVPRWGALPLLVQLPVWFALYRVIAETAAGHAVGAMTLALVTSFGGATLLGVRLAQSGYLGSSPAHTAAVFGLAGVVAMVSWVTQKFFVLPNTVTDGMPDAMIRVHHLMPVLSAAGMIVAAGVVPVGLLLYWLCNSLWTLAQSAVIWRWFPTPGSAAALRWSHR